MQQLRDLSGLLSPDRRVVRVIVGTGALMDHPLREPGDYKRAGRTGTTREAARKADQPLKGLRNSGDAPPQWGPTKAWRAVSSGSRRSSPVSSETARRRG
ncbi:hypothetical protein OOK58_53480 [Streptomyces sp. NBC_01728]|uniref:hypothetical protein n=1 Tax=unclassified Streptomyces TaxID=2593676 RepID=UPI002253A87C|nr:MULTISPECIES: hypothetical protein [unclassified Streptomyces]MCX4460775.1 hypothetical protein [Streptomyces sp. NBC_01719]MCX4499895.1 hypothetical protein [Streptomyces sp. NBC_01728]